MFKLPRLLPCLLTTLCVTVLSLGTARGQPATSIARSITLRIRVLAEDGEMVRARLELSSLRPSLVLVQYTNAVGQAEFTGLASGLYTLTAEVYGMQSYRNELMLAENDRFRTEVIRVSRPAANAKPEIVSLNELSAPPKAKNLFDAGVEAVHSSRWASAIEALNQAVAVYPGYARAHNARGVVLAILKNEKESEQAFRKAIECDPMFAEPHYNLGRLLLETNRPLEARRELERNLQLNPGYPPAIQLLVESMIQTDDEEAAVALMNSADKKNIQHSVQLHLEIAFALEKLSRLELASEQYSLVLKENADESERQEAKAGLARLEAQRRSLH
jgi:Tfp pilus assembly protein PilF